MHETPCVDPRILLVVNNLGKGSPIIIFLAETFNGLDAIHKGEVTFFARGPLLLQV